MFYFAKSAIIMLILFFVFSATSKLQAEEITHIVVCWLDPKTDKSEINNIVHQSKLLASLPGVLSYDIGEPLPSKRSAVEDSYSFALSVKFDSKESMYAYVENEKHKAFVENILKPKLSKIVIYDFASSVETPRTDTISKLQY